MGTVLVSVGRTRGPWKLLHIWCTYGSKVQSIWRYEQSNQSFERTLFVFLFALFALRAVVPFSFSSLISFFSVGVLDLPRRLTSFGLELTRATRQPALHHEIGTRRAMV